MKIKSLILAAMIPAISLADVSLVTQERTIQVLDEKGNPVEGAIVEYAADYEKCGYVFWAWKCEEVTIADEQILTDSEGKATIPAFNVSKKDGFNKEYNRMEYVISVNSMTTPELERDYSDCGYQLTFNLMDMAKSQNLIDHQNTNNTANSCFYYLGNQDEDPVVDELQGDIVCQLAGKRDEGFQNGQRVITKIPLLEGIEDYKKTCNEDQ